jgi:hypothetical protein
LDGISHSKELEALSGTAISMPTLDQLLKDQFRFQEYELSD